MTTARRNALLDRLDAIANSLAHTERALALIGLGSVGRELERLDEYSDLDFFVVVEPGYKACFVDDLSWLRAAHTLAYHFRNTADGYKFLFADGIYGEMAVFGLNEVAGATFAPGRIVWRREDVNAAIAMPHDWPPRSDPPAVEWLLGEALTNLYVGLSRFRRGEKLSAFRFIQGNAVDRVMELAALVAEGVPGAEDVLDGPRRFEQRYPALETSLPSLMQGYERSPESAAALLALLGAHFDLDGAITAAIRGLLDDPAAAVLT